jgi:hypothetical protein
MVANQVAGATPLPTRAGETVRAAGLALLGRPTRQAGRHLVAASIRMAGKPADPPQRKGKPQSTNEGM